LAWLWAKLFSPRKSGPEKNATYECGIESKGDAWVQFKSEYYLYAIIFLVFDVETVFIFPWAVVMKNAGITGFVEIIIFFFVLGLGLLYAWKKGALKWE
jgi:NADH-quinone oxidoreductase subunit A